MDETAKLNGTMMEETEEQQKQNNINDDNDADAAKGVRWERFLPRLVLRVLLVESDNSTRQIITALLRKCSYTVIAVSDGLKAWEMLMREAPDVDLILTEVELPSISGFALLSLIMEHDICKNIPVIMMSSHDSVNMVLKCMLKGAADFLIKPIRRNELRNLWQHVWRRHAISTPPLNTTFPQKILKSASEDKSTSNKSTSSVASSKKNNECSERLSEAQSTCTSPILEAESTYMENMQDSPQLKSSKLSDIDTEKHEEFTKFARGSAKHKHDDETGEKSITTVSEAARCNKTIELMENENKVLRSELGRDNPNINVKMHGCNNKPVEPSKGAIDLIATFENLPKHPNENFSLHDGNATKFDCDTQLELSLRGDFPGSSSKQARKATEESQRLNHSTTSAFSWYSNSKLSRPPFQTPSVTSAKINNPIGDSHEFHKLSGIASSNCCQHGGTNLKLENVTSTVIGQCGQVKPKLSNSQCRVLPVAGAISDLKSKEHGNVFTSVFYAQSGTHPMWNSKPAPQNESSPFPTNASSQSNPESYKSDQLHDWSNEASHRCFNPNVKDNTDSNHARNDSSAADQSAGNSSCHRVANHITSSAHGSMGSGNDGNATSALVSKNNPDGFSDSGCHNNYDGFGMTDSCRSSQREAALTKFRLKRKERCFRKKVRYQSRKRLAEQRPRVKGQFVRQEVHNDPPVADAGGDS
ncbi:hypothetical protein RJT34_15738 [Clitoria ternatea]|uniref:Uncharacterized protein n=1 Tax=Clitoria ternatea TaxID=43366 RepID=A0AAN9J662_CLITE